MASVAMQTDGNLVLYAPGANPLWNSNRQRGATLGANRFDVGYCTWGAAEKWHQAAGSYPGFSGNAYQWASNAQGAGYSVSMTPQPRAVVVFPVSSAYGSVGHVAWVDSVQSRPDGTYISITEMNYKGWNTWDTRVVRHSSDLRYILVPYGP